MLLCRASLDDLLKMILSILLLFCLSVVGVLCGGTTVRGLVGMWRSWCRAVNAVGRPLGGRWAGRRRASSWQDVRNPTSLPLMNTPAQGAVVFQLLNGGGSAKVAVIPAAALLRGHVPGALTRAVVPCHS